MVEMLQIVTITEAARNKLNNFFPEFPIFSRLSDLSRKYFFRVAFEKPNSKNDEIDILAEVGLFGI